jgi:peptide-methionine (S)-S-oxide reductase
MPPNPPVKEEAITLACGCFWCLEAVYTLVDGVLAVESGYSNGHVHDPSYEQVCGGDTGHAEVVQVRFDPQRISLAEILEIFFHIHDPTTLNRQGNDVGPQYRSGIYWHEPAQEAVVREVLAAAQAAHGGRVVTEVEARRNYWRAEAYHQRYFANHPGQGYCSFVVAPKVEKFRRTFKARVRAAAI